MALDSYWVVQSEAVWGTTYITLVSLFFNATFTLLILVGLNALCKRLTPKAALRQGELLTIYIMLCLGSSLAGNNFLENLVISLGHSFWFATPEKEWSELSFRYVPDWMLETTISRIRAELGPPMHEIGWVGPDTILVTAVGPRRLGGRSLTMLAFLYFTDRTVSSHPMPHQLEGFKIAERIGMNAKRLAAVMMVSITVGIISALWVLLHLRWRNLASGPW